jgi:hypothetical protein
MIHLFKNAIRSREKIRWWILFNLTNALRVSAFYAIFKRKQYRPLIFSSKYNEKTVKALSISLRLQLCKQYTALHCFSFAFN